MGLKLGWLLGCLAVLFGLCSPRSAWSQTPSPMQEWQYSGGIILARLFEPNLPEWRVVLGTAADTQPVYSGADAFRVQGGPVIDIQYRDIAFLSTGDGLGVNFLRGDHYRVGAAIAYDRGRLEREDYNNLRGMGDIRAAPVAKVFASYVLSKKFPLILRVDARQLLGGANGAVGDAGLYMPLPGSSKKFVMFAGPSITLATHRYLQSEFGVTPQQSLASGHPVFDPHAGMVAAGVGFSATRFITEHWLLNLDAAVSQLKGSPDVSPITESRTQRELALSIAYHSVAVSSSILAAPTAERIPENMPDQSWVSITSGGLTAQIDPHGAQLSSLRMQRFERTSVEWRSGGMGGTRTTVISHRRRAGRRCLSAGFEDLPAFKTRLRARQTLHPPELEPEQRRVLFTRRRFDLCRLSLSNLNWTFATSYRARPCR